MKIKNLIILEFLDRFTYVGKWHPFQVIILKIVC